MSIVPSCAGTNTLSPDLTERVVSLTVSSALPSVMMTERKLSLSTGSLADGETSMRSVVKYLHCAIMRLVYPS